MQHLISARATLVSVVLFLSLSAGINLRAESPREQLNALVAQLQANPGDNALREQIIKLAQGIDPAPAVPEEARRAFIQGNSAFTDAKTPEELDRAIAFYRDASNRAPWWGDVYFNLAKALEQRQSYADAIAALNVYLLAAPTAPDARDAQDKIYALEEKSERATKETMAQQVVADQAAQQRQWASALMGQLNDMFSGKVSHAWKWCNVGGNDLSTGCTLNESQGTNWYSSPDEMVPAWGLRFETSPEGDRIVMFNTGTNDNTPFAIGSPNGPSLDEIQWRFVQNNTPVLFEFWIDGNTTWQQKVLPPVSSSTPMDTQLDPNRRYIYEQWGYR